MRVQLYNAVLFLSMDYKKDIFAVFTYEFELSRVIRGASHWLFDSMLCKAKLPLLFHFHFSFLFGNDKLREEKKEKDIFAFSMSDLNLRKGLSALKHTNQRDIAGNVTIPAILKIVLFLR